MRNSFIITILTVLTGFHAWSQELETDSVKLPFESKTVDLGFGIVQNWAKSTASTATVGSEELNRRAAINLNDALYGRLLGLTALKGGGWAGDVGYGASYNIRGIQTLTDEKNILILVDGLERTIDELSLDEVESVILLKDAAAVALYGYRGINGILDVKTKRGPQSGLVVGAKYNHKFTFGALTPEYVDAYTYAGALNEARSNDGMGPVYNQHELNAFQNNTYPLVYPNVDWKKETLRDVGSEDILSVSVANGGERLKYFTMLNYTNSHGLLDGTELNKARSGYSTQLKYSKANIRANLDFDMTRTTKMQVNMLGILSESNRPSSLSAYQLFDVLYKLPSAAFPVRTKDGLWGGDNNFASINPVARTQETGYRREFATTLFADVQLKQSLEDWVEGLSLSARLGYDNYSRIYEDRNRAFQYASDRYTFNYDGSIASTVRQSGGNKSNALTFSRGRLGNNSDRNGQSDQGYWRRLNLILSADYHKEIDEHNMAASVFYSQNQSVTPGRYHTFFRHNISSYLHYDLSGKYLADVVLMYSGSNRSYPVKWSFSPTVSLGWILSEEDFLKGNDIVNFLKLRASAGILHTDFVPRQGLWLSDYVWSYSYFWGTTGGGYSGVSGTRLDYLPTSKFKLETANKYNLGIDLLLFKSLGLTVEGYYQRRHNILMSESGVNSAILGLAPAYINKGIVDSKGVELGLNYDNTFGDFRLYIGGMFTYGVNKVVDIAEEPKAFPYMELKGRPVNSHRGLEAIGFFKDEEEIRTSPTQMFSLVQPGDIKYKDQNNDGMINENDFVPIGYSGDVPEINYAFNLGFEWKGFGVNALVQGASHFTKWYIPGVSRPLVSRNNISVEYYDNRWAPGADNTNAKYPRLASGTNPNNERNSTVWYRDASFFKLRNCELYYRTQQLKNIYIKELKLSVRGENLFTSSGIDLIDPEMPYAGYPTLKGVSVGLSLTF